MIQQLQQEEAHGPRAVITGCLEPAELSRKLDQTEDVVKGDAAGTLMSAPRVRDQSREVGEIITWPSGQGGTVDQWSCTDSKKVVGLNLRADQCISVDVLPMPVWPPSTHLTQQWFSALLHHLLPLSASCCHPSFQVRERRVAVAALLFGAA
ncbi:unnamed protein product [Pleuronectes platessa]|uniref:Uncharacterized protein n=1 Tax=Pleuronectes platessa TaxID=8262 RepID=A0A9N7VJD7_PLEPL|nr:unnamed protein product [Pleuronectes platessa]